MFSASSYCCNTKINLAKKQNRNEIIIATNKADNPPVEKCTAWGVCKATGAETAHCVCVSGDVAPWNRHRNCQNPLDTERQSASHDLWHGIALTFDFGTKMSFRNIYQQRVISSSQGAFIYELMFTHFPNMSKKCSQSPGKVVCFVGVNCVKWGPSATCSVTLTPDPGGWLCFLWTESCRSRCRPPSSRKVPGRKHTHGAQFHVSSHHSFMLMWMRRGPLQINQVSGQSRYGGVICWHGTDTSKEIHAFQWRILMPIMFFSCSSLYVICIY